MNRASHIVEFWPTPAAEVRAEHEPKEVDCADEAEAIALEEKFHAIGWAVRTVTLTAKADNPARCACGEPAVVLRGWPFPTLVCDGSKPREFQWPFGLISPTPNCPRKRLPQQISACRVDAQGGISSSAQHMVRQLTLSEQEYEESMLKLNAMQ